MYNICLLEPLKEEWVFETEQKICEEINVIDNISNNSKILKDAQILIGRDRNIDISILELCESLRFLFILSAGVEKLPFELLRKKNIIVANASGISDEIISEYVVGAMLNFSIRFRECMICQLKNEWKYRMEVESLKDKTVLIIGAGKIGCAIAQKARLFNMKVIGIKKRIKSNELFHELYNISEMEGVLNRADFVINALPDTSETRGIINYSTFKHMKNTAVFINISRGGIVQQEDMVRAIKEKLIFGAVLDVFEEEPLEEINELWKFDNVIITPHIAGRIKDYLYHSLQVFVKNYIAFSNNSKLPNQINLFDEY